MTDSESECKEQGNRQLEGKGEIQTYEARLGAGIHSTHIHRLAQSNKPNKKMQASITKTEEIHTQMYKITHLRAHTTRTQARTHALTYKQQK